MPRLVTVKKAEQERQHALRYVKNSLVYPSALIGLTSLILGYGGVIYLIYKSRPLAGLFTDSFVLLCIGLLLGFIQALYHQYLLRSHPEFFADKIHRMNLRLAGRIKKIGDPVRIQHVGRWAVPYLYLLGFGGLIYLVVIYTPKLNILSSVFLLLAGFHNARFFYLKRLIKK